LSFTTVTGVIVLTGPIRRLAFGRWLRRRGLMVFEPGRRWRRWLYFGAADWLIMLVCVSAAAYVASVPLVAYHFGLFSPYAAVLSLLLLPVVAAVLVPAYLSLGLSWLMPNASWQLGRCAGAIGGSLEWAVLGLRRLPGLSVEVYPLPPALVVLCYAAIGAWAASGRLRRGRTLAALLTAGAVAWGAWTQRPTAPPAGADLHVLDVGHGLAALLHTADGATVLFDAGSLAPGSAHDGVFRPFLRAARLPAPRAAFCSHPNTDHYNILTEMLGRRPPRTVYLNESFGVDPGGDPDLARLMDSLSRADVEVVRLRAGRTVRLGGGVEVETVWPPGQPQIGAVDANNSSLVLRVTVAGRRVLLTGDIEGPVQRLLADGPADRIAADVLVLPHHGTATESLKDFIAAVGADTLVQSASWRNDSQAFLDAIAGRRRLATFRDGYIRIALRAEGITVETMRSP